MTINQIREDIESNIGREVNVILNVGRNRKEYFKAEIEAAYPFIFIMRVLDSKDGEVKSFSYSDVLTSLIQIKFE